MPETISGLRFKLLEAKANGLRQYEVAAAVKIHPSILSNLADGKVHYMPWHIKKLCEYFQVSSEFLMGKVELPNFDEREERDEVF